MTRYALPVVMDWMCPVCASVMPHRPIRCLLNHALEVICAGERWTRR